MPKLVEKCSDRRTFSQIVASGILRCGPMPKHVAFVMDGNRRYAKKLGLPVIKGHVKGQNVLENVILWALALKIPMITAYAFSIENFKRSGEEVEKLIELFLKALNCMNASKDNGLEKYGVRFQIIGNWDLIPYRLQPYVAKLHYDANEHPESALMVNVALAYTSRDAMYRSFKTITEGYEDLNPSDVTQGIFQHLHSIFPIPPVDLFIRTGGDTRLSDFMLWESSYAHIEFLDITWPEFTFWEFWKAIFRFQTTPRKQDPHMDGKLTRKQLKFISMHRDKMWREMELAAARFEKSEAPEVLILTDNWLKKAFVALLDF